MSQLTELLAKSSAQFRILDLSALTNTVRCWDGGTIPNLIEATREDHDWTRLPILADALEEAGSTDTSLLAHLRYPVAASETVWLVTESPPITAAGWLAAFKQAKPRVVLGVRVPVRCLLENLVFLPNPGSARLAVVTGEALGFEGQTPIDQIRTMALEQGLKHAPGQLAPLFRLLHNNQGDKEERIYWSMTPVPTRFKAHDLQCTFVLSNGYKSGLIQRKIELKWTFRFPITAKINWMFLCPVDNGA